MNHRWQIIAFCLAAVVSAAGLAPARAGMPAAPEARVDGQVREQLVQRAQVRVLIYLRGQADLSGAHEITDWEQRGRFVYQRLREAAERDGRDLGGWLLRAGARPRTLLSANAIGATVDAALLEALAARPEVARIGPDKSVHLLDSRQGTESFGPTASVEWGIAKIRADQVWEEFGLRGQGITVGTVGTGVMLEHAALVQQYRGNLGGGVFDHNYNWFDLINGQPEPYDDQGHSTFTTGVMVGSDGGVNQIGVAPGGQWIVVKALDEYGSASLEDLHAAMDWMLAPTDLDGANPDPARRPHVGLNAWGLWGGCDPEFNLDVLAWQAAGILPVFGIGGDGPGCQSIRSPADMVGTFTAGATDSSDDISPFSARGPGCWGPLKPEVSAPGINIRSSTNDGGYQVWSGTSFSAAHLGGAAALVLSANPALGLDELQAILKDTAVCREELTCGGAPCPDGLNNTYGWGRIDVYEAVVLARSLLPAMHVSAIKVSYRDLGMGRYALQGAVRIKDQAQQAVPQAAVGVEWTLPDGSVQFEEAATGLNGVARLRLRSRQTGEHRLCVSGVAKVGWIYDPDQNVETCEAATVP